LAQIPEFDNKSKNSTKLGRIPGFNIENHMFRIVLAN
jgi:hypothetical protein